jgi:tellurite methyltransferase
MSKHPRPRSTSPSPRAWAGYYRWTSKRPPRELLNQVLNHIDWEHPGRRRRTAIDLGCGAGNDSLELLRRGWDVLAIDGQAGAARFLEGRVPSKDRARLTCLVARMEDLDLPPADLIYASFSLPFCAPDMFPELWSKIRRAVRPGGHFAGQLFGDRDAWNGHRPMSFHSAQQVRALSRGYKVELVRETVEDGMSYGGPKHWHFFDVILGKPPMRRHAYR